jgi:hypothetical protein
MVQTYFYSLQREHEHLFIETLHSMHEISSIILLSRFLLDHDLLSVLIFLNYHTHKYIRRSGTHAHKHTHKHVMIYGLRFISVHLTY